MVKFQKTHNETNNTVEVARKCDNVYRMKNLLQASILQHRADQNTEHIRSHFCHCHCKRNDKEVPRLKICIHSSLLIKAISGADRSSLDPRMCNVQPSAAIANWDRWINVKLIEFRMQFSSSLKGFSAQKIYFASNLIFWVGMGWGTGHWAQNTQNNHKKLVPGTS